MTGLPKHDSAGFFDEISALSPHVADAFTVKRFEQRAKAFLATDACLAYQALGAVAAIRGDTEEMREEHEKAIRLRPSDVQVYTNYATSLARTGFLNEAYELLREHFSAFCSSPELVRRYMRAMVQCGRLGQIEEVANDLERLQPSSAEDNLTRVGRNFAEIFRNRGVDDESTSVVVRIAEEVMHANNFFFATTDIRAVTDDESDYVSFVIRVAADRKQIGRLTDELIGRIVDDEVPSNTTSAFVVRFAAVPDEPFHGNQTI